MAIAQSDINTNWLELDESAQVGHVQFGVDPDQRRKRWIIVPLANGSYAVFRFEHVVEAVIEFTGETKATQQMLNLRLAELPNLFTRYAHPPVDAATGDAEKIRAALNPLSDTPPVILRGGAVVGVLDLKLRGGGDVEFFDSVQHMASANGGDHPPKNGGAEEAAPPAPAPGTLGPETQPAGPPPRLINVRFEPPEQKDQPLQVGETYTLVFSVELEKLAQAIAAAVLDDRLIFPPNVDQVDLFVQLLSEDFDILTDPQKLIVPREGKSKNRARFDIVPKHNGESELTAVFSRDGNAVQAITLKLNVGVAGQAAIVKTETLGRPVDSAGAAKPRGLSMWIDYIGEGFKFSYVGAESQPSFLIPLQLHELEQAINEARAALKEIVEFKDKGNLVYQTGIDIPAAVSQKTLPRLAEAGFLLFQTIFMHPGASQASKDFAKRLRELAKGETLKIQINSKEMMLPWGILYLADRFDPNDIKPELFLGLKHIIEHMPMEPNMDFPADIPSQPQLTVSLNLNKEIDAQMGFPLIGNQIKYWDGVKDKGGVSLITRTTGNDLINAFADQATPDQIVYFYCHAVSKGLNEGGPRASILQLGTGQSVTLKDFMLRAPNDIRLTSAPLIFLNACESAELSPLFYNGFMPYFVDKGARGMIGTECPVPALFAADWAKNFFDRFLKGQSLGQVFLDLRREYFFNQNNILGLLYAVYCNADTEVAPPLGG